MHARDFLFIIVTSKNKIMCLITTQKEPMVAEKDITCYKALIKLSYDDDGYITPFQGYPVLNDIVNHKGLMKPSKLSKIEKDSYYTYVGEGYIHTYANAVEAATFSHSSCEIFECIIPKGTEYYVDSFDGGMASTSIRFVRRVL